MRRQTRRRGHWRDGEDWRFMRSSPTSNTGTAPQTPTLASPTRAPRRNEPHTPVEQSPVIGLPAKEALLNDPPNPVLIESTTVLARDVSYAFWISHPVPYLIHRLD